MNRPDLKQSLFLYIFDGPFEYTVLLAEEALHLEFM